MFYLRSERTSEITSKFSCLRLLYRTFHDLSKSSDESSGEFSRDGYLFRIEAKQARVFSRMSGKASSATSIANCRYGLLFPFFGPPFFRR